MAIKYLTTEQIFNTLNEHREVLKKYDVKKIGLFGSYAKSEQKENSDIDFLVEFNQGAFGKDFKGYFDCYMDLLFFLENVFKKKVDLLTVEEISPYMRSNILKEVKYIERT